MPTSSCLVTAWNMVCSIKHVVTNVVRLPRYGGGFGDGLSFERVS